MPESLQKDFYGFVFERAFVKAADAAGEDAKYAPLSEEIDSLTRKIKSLLGQNDELLLELERVNNLMECIFVEHAYRQGLKDGIQLRQELGLTN